MMLFLSFMMADNHLFSFQALADLMRTLKPGGWIELLEVKINLGGGGERVIEGGFGAWTFFTHTRVLLYNIPFDNVFLVHRSLMLNMRMLVPR